MPSQTNGCAAPAGGLGLVGRDLTREAVIQGTVLQSGRPVPAAYVRLLDRSGEFTAEVQTDNEGAFRFFAGEGTWTLRVLVPATDVVDRVVHAATGAISEVTITV